MDLVFVAEQYAQAQAVAMAQYYANAAALGNQPGAPSGGIVVTNASTTSLGLVPPPIISGTGVLGAQFTQPALTTSGSMPQPPPPPSIESSRDSDSSSRSKDKKDRRDRDRGRDRDRDRNRDRDRDRDRDRKDRDRDRRDRDRDRERDRDRDRDRRSERDRDRDRDRDRERRDRDRDRRRDRSPRQRSRSPRRDRDRDRTPDSDEEPKNIPPNNTIMVRGLAQHINESNIQDDITSCGLVARDIRLIRKKETGASRGFAFVEFASVQDAEKWMEEKQGVLMFKDQYRAVMQYSLPREGKPGEPPKLLHDWICSKCGVQNFRRRDQCFKCGGPKTDDGEEDEDEISANPTNTVLLRGLDVLSTEDSVLNCLMRLTQLPIKSIKVGRDNLTNTSRGVCYVEMNTVVDAVFLHNQLLGEPPQIDDKLVSVSYYRSRSQAVQQTAQNSSAAANAAMAAAQWSHQGKGQYTDEEIESLAEYSAAMYAKTPEEKVHYLQYYREFYRNGGKLDASTKDEAKEATSAISDKPKDKSDLGTVLVNGVEYKKFATPDVTSYVYDETSGYYYDSTTTYYYDSNSQYYFDSKTNKYLYWSGEHQTYLPAPDGSKEKGDVKKDKTKSAQRIAKDMEKWSRKMNQKKEAAKEKQMAATATTQKSAAGGSTEDIAFSMLQKRDVALEGSTVALSGIADYRSDGSEEDANDDRHTDWDKLACLLCKRAFPSREKLVKHNNISELHKQNLEQFRKNKSLLPPAPQHYRDRAKERRLKYGEADEEVKPSRLKEKYLGELERCESLPEKSIGGDNIGNKMLQKMGWKEGLGLGKSNQGRTSIIEAERRNAQAGLGSGSAVRTNPNDSYKDCVKKTMFQRYRDME